MSDNETLESRLGVLRAGAAERFPKLLELNERMIADLEASVMRQALDVGDSAPDFELRRAEDDDAVRLFDALKLGPAVLSFYRGNW